MNIEELTVGQLKEITRLAGAMGSRCVKPKTLERKRVVLVVDRGWIFAGDQELTSDGFVRLTNAVHVFSWQSIGFAKMLEQWKDSKVDLRKVADVEVPRDSVIFRVPVAEGWGIK